jgi:hypothetical protein
MDSDTETEGTKRIKCPVGYFCYSRLSKPFSDQSLYDSYLQANARFEKGEITKIALQISRDKFCKGSRRWCD